MTFVSDTAAYARSGAAGAAAVRAANRYSRAKEQVKIRLHSTRKMLWLKISCCVPKPMVTMRSCAWRSGVSAVNGGARVHHVWNRAQAGTQPRARATGFFGSWTGLVA